MRRNVSSNNAAVVNTANKTNCDYEIKIGKTVYVISHDYGKSDFTDIIADYLADKIPIKNKATAA